MGDRHFFSLDGPLDALPTERQMRIANLSAFPGLVRSLGADPRPLLERHGIDPRLMIVAMDPDSISCGATATFEDVEGGPFGTNYDGLVWSGGMLFGGRFFGQTLGFSGDFDVVTGAPLNPITPLEGSAGQNLSVFLYLSNVLAGLGPLGFPDMDAIGEGSMALYLPTPQPNVKLDIVGGNGGSATLDFYRADGSLLGTVVVTGLGEFTYGFSTDDGTTGIAGILVQSTDPAGFGLDNVCHEGSVVVSAGRSTPTTGPGVSSTNCLPLPEKWKKHLPS